MPKWEVILKDPLYRNENWAKALYKDIVEADTEYGAKKEFYDNLLIKHPEIPRTPILAVLPHLRLKNLESKKPKFSEYPPNAFFEAVRNNLRLTSIEEELENSRYLMHLVLFVSEEGIELGKIPKICPICNRPTENLIFHHWNSKKDIGDSNKHKNFSIINGFYRRMCKSCNISLGGIFKGKYPTSWKDQLETLKEYFKQYPKTYPLPIVEKPWSLLSEEEWNRLKYLWDHTPKDTLQKSFISPKTNRQLLKSIK